VFQIIDLVVANVIQVISGSGSDDDIRSADGFWTAVLRLFTGIQAWCVSKLADEQAAFAIDSLAYGEIWTRDVFKLADTGPSLCNRSSRRRCWSRSGSRLRLQRTSDRGTTSCPNWKSSKVEGYIQRHLHMHCCRTAGLFPLHHVPACRLFSLWAVQLAILRI
jgi:hypothetical protein